MLAIFLETLNITAPVFAMLFLGVLLKRIDWINDNFIHTASALVFNVTMPALLFLGILHADLHAALQPLGGRGILCIHDEYIAEVPEARADEARALLGWPLDKDAVLAQASPVRDQWQVMGVIQEEREGGLMERRVWLHGLHTGQRALVLDHAFAGRAFEQAWMCPATVDAALAFYPSAAPLRALVAGAGSEADAAPAAQGAGTSTPAQEWHAVARRMADNPWGFLHPLRCHDATMAHDADHFYLHWGTAVLPLQLRQADGWTLLALGAGHALTVQGEWDGQALRPLSAHSPEGVWIWSPA